MLNTEPIALEVARSVCRPGGPLDNEIAIRNAREADVVEHLAQIDTDVVAGLLERVLTDRGDFDLRELESDARRQIVHAVERIAFDSATFDRGAELMLRLALAENEDWGNNATGQFNSLFPVLLADTAATGDQRLAFLDRQYDAAAPKVETLIVSALRNASRVDHFSRSLGAESFGMRRALKPWEPTHRETWAYITGSVERLARFALRDDAVGVQARSALANNTRALVARGFIDPVEAAVRGVVAARGPYWPDALASLGQVITYDLAEVPHVEARVRALIAAVQPDTLSDRVQMIVTEMPWDYPCDEEVDFDVREQRQREAVFDVADDVLASTDALADALPRLSTGAQRMAGVFGEALAQKAADPHGLAVAVLAAYTNTPQDRRNPDLATSFLAELSKTDPAWVEELKDHAIRQPVAAALVPLTAWKSGFTERDIRSICGALDSGLLGAQDLHAWIYGGRLAQLPTKAVAPLFDRLFADPAAAPFGFDLLGMYVHGQRERLEDLRPQVLRAAQCALVKSQHTMNDHHFTELMRWMLDHGRGDADARTVALTLSRALAEKAELEHLSNDRRIRPLLGVLLREFPEVSWPLIGQAIVANPKTAWRFEYLMSHGTSAGGDGDIPITCLPQETLFAWCHAHPDTAPAFAAKTLPLLGLEAGAGRFHPLIRRLLDEFGDREDVRSQLYSILYTFGWSGSLSTYFERFQAPLQDLVAHCRQAAVRRWARLTSQQLAEQIRHELNYDEERNAAWE